MEKDNTNFIKLFITSLLLQINVQAFEGQFKNTDRRHSIFLMRGVYVYSRDCTGLLLSHLRNGPTLRFDLIPMDLRQMLHSLSTLQENLQGDIRKIASSFYELKVNLRC